MTTMTIGKKELTVRPQGDLTWGEWLDIKAMHTEIEETDDGLGAMLTVYEMLKLIVPELTKDILYDVKTSQMESLITEAMTKCVSAGKTTAPEEEDTQGRTTGKKSVTKG